VSKRPRLPARGMVQANATRSSQFLLQSGFVGFVRFVVPHLLCRAAANSTANPAELIRPRIGRIARMSGRGSVRGGQAAVVACEGDGPSKCDKVQSIPPSIWIRGIRAIRGPPPSVSPCRELNREPSGVDSTTNRTNRTNEWSGECSWWASGRDCLQGEWSKQMRQGPVNSSLNLDSWDSCDSWSPTFRVALPRTQPRTQRS
jgi:hypothetical protein